MRGMRVLRGVCTWLAVAGFCLPQSVLAAGVPVAAAPIVFDVTLRDGGVLLGQVVDPQGVAQTKVPVSVRDRDREVAASVTDAHGYFAVRGLRGGVYTIMAGAGGGTFRVWQPGTAPPSAQQGALVMAERATIRGQCAEGCAEPTCGPTGCAMPCAPACGLMSWMSNPWVVTGIVATAIAVPVAIHNSGKPASP